MRRAPATERTRTSSPTRSWRACGIACALPSGRLCETRADYLEVAELLDPPAAVLPADAAPFHPAERREGPCLDVLVDPRGPAFEALRDLLAAGDVGGPDRPAEPVV